MRQVHRACERLFIDYCGLTLPIINQATGEVRNAQLFVAVLGASSVTFAEASWSQSLLDWILSHKRTFPFLGGVPELLVPDNLKSAVTRACRYDSQLNATYAELA
ncbi:DDE-type integrase/transposase/recombinase [Halomonas denitrificans]|uniref:DDE-type integrase/transposase/recombinase n=1 Tax=Halomonas denitrificans TaxID=370769 RepID=UPI001B876CE0|nr:DDE-type integrase/transposase/recombinase [Halomonas denitrificans]